MIKKQLLFILICGMMLPLLWGQSTNGVYVHNGQKFKYQNNNWYKVDSTKTYRVVKNKLAIKFIDSLSDSLRVDFEQQFGLNEVGHDLSDWYFYTFTANQNSNLFNKVNNIKTRGCVNQVVIPTYGKLNSPNDPNFSGQWHINSSYASHIKVEDAWNITKGDPSVEVAILDAGIDMDHEDLSKNILLNKKYDFFDDDNDPNPDNTSHGTMIAGIIGAATDNSIGIAGIAGGWTSNDGVKLQVYRIADDVGVDPFAANYGIYEAVNNGADIINLSAEFDSYQLYIENAIEYAYSQGVIVISSSGTGGFDQVSFPASLPYVIAVGAHDYASFDAVSRVSTSNYGDDLNLCAPGDIIQSTANDDTYNTAGGNSYSAAIVTGVVALMKSVNPCLRFDQVKDILTVTSAKIGQSNYHYDKIWGKRPGFNQEMGYGQVDAYEAVLKASQLVTNNLDLYMKDRYDDLGFEPGPVTEFDFDNSPDIWVRNDQKGFDNQFHEDPVYDGPGDKAFIYVRVTNRSCVMSDNMILKLYYHKASATSDSWPNDWTFIDETDVHIMNGGESRIMMIEWPLDALVNENGACLIATIDGPDDVLPSGIGIPLSDWIRESNNVAMKNLKLINTKNPYTWNGLDVPPGGPVFIGNLNENSSKLFNVYFGYDQNNNSQLLEEAEINVFVKDEFWDIVDNSPNVDFVDIEVTDENNLRLVGEDASIVNLNFDPVEETQIYLGFNFYGELSEDEDKIVRYVLKQYESEEEKWNGNLHYRITKEARDRFEADAGGTQIVPTGQNILLSGNSLNESATYSWSVLGDTTKISSKSFSILPSSTTKYVYEVEADEDGFKSYDTTTVFVNPYKITGLTPNPASTTLQVNYVADKASKAGIIIQMSSDPKIRISVPVDPNLTSVIANISALPIGVYNVILVCDGKQVAAQSLLIQ